MVRGIFSVIVADEAINRRGKREEGLLVLTVSDFVLFLSPSRSPGVVF